jgi:hypothetical protein
MPHYKVMIDDNFHYMDDSERLEFGTFATAEEAIGICRKIVDEWLKRHHKPGMTGDQLFELYVGFGEDPYVIAPIGDADPATAGRFSAWDYARERAKAMCGR